MLKMAALFALRTAMSFLNPTSMGWNILGGLYTGLSGGSSYSTGGNGSTATDININTSNILSKKLDKVVQAILNFEPVNTQYITWSDVNRNTRIANSQALVIN